MSTRAIVIAGVLGLAVLVIVSLWVGPGSLSFADVVNVLALRLRGTSDDSLARALVWDLRLPRALLAAAVGAALAAAGAITQGLLRNPMAEPSVLGVSAGAATAAVLGFAIEIDRLGLWVTPLLAAIGAAAVLALLLALHRPVGGYATLLLSGIALSALCSSIITLVLAIGTERWDLGLKVVRWLMGSFEGRSWSHLLAMLIPLALGSIVCAWLCLDLDALALGPETAESLGVDLGRTRVLAMLAVGLLVGAATALCGVIGFVGLVIPHIARMATGPRHRAAIPAAMIFGAAALLGVDTIGRTLPMLALPPGVITSLLGAPFFLWLLRRHEPGTDA